MHIISITDPFQHSSSESHQQTRMNDDDSSVIFNISEIDTLVIGNKAFTHGFKLVVLINF